MYTATYRAAAGGASASVLSCSSAAVRFPCVRTDVPAARGPPARLGACREPIVPAGPRRTAGRGPATSQQQDGFQTAVRRLLLSIGFASSAVTREPHAASRDRRVREATWPGFGGRRCDRGLDAARPATRPRPSAGSSGWRKIGVSDTQVRIVGRQSNRFTVRVSGGLSVTQVADRHSRPTHDTDLGQIGMLFQFRQTASCRPAVALFATRRPADRSTRPDPGLLLPCRFDQRFRLFRADRSSAASGPARSARTAPPDAAAGSGVPGVRPVRSGSAGSRMTRPDRECGHPAELAAAVDSSHWFASSNRPCWYSTRIKRSYTCGC